MEFSPPRPGFDSRQGLFFLARFPLLFKKEEKRKGPPERFELSANPSEEDRSTTELQGLGFLKKESTTGGARTRNPPVKSRVRFQLRHDGWVS